MKPIKDSAAGRRTTVFATAGFLIAAVALIYFCIRLVGSFAKTELRGEDSKQYAPQSSPSVSPEAQVESLESASEAALILVPDEEEALPSPLVPTQTPLPSPSATPVASPEATMPPLAKVGAFSSSNMDVLLVGMDESGHADWIVATTLRNGDCRLISIPRNTLVGETRALYDCVTSRAARNALESAYPVQFTYYISLDLSGLNVIADAFGGLTIGGKTMDGAAVNAYLTGAGSEELLRIERQQIVIRAMLEAIRPLGWLKLLSLKYSLQKYVASNLSLTQSVELYSALKRTDVSSIRFSILPVDSDSVGGARCYRADAALVSEIVTALYGS